MKKRILTLVLLFFAAFINAQKTYLKVTKSDKTYDYMIYPPGTKFELKNQEGDIILSDSDEPGMMTFDENFTLYVYPSWKDEAEIFKLRNGKVEKLLTSNFSRKTLIGHSVNNNGITMKKTLVKSDINPELYNATFKFSNGIVATYTDGEFKASLNGERLRAEYKYIIYSDLGVLKLSFNPRNSETWWIFEEKK